MHGMLRTKGDEGDWHIRRSWVGCCRLPSQDGTIPVACQRHLNLQSQAPAHAERAELSWLSHSRR